MIAFTGTRDLRPAQIEIIEAVLVGLPKGSCLVVGGAIGVDTAVARAGRHMGHHIYLVAPAAYYDHENLLFAHEVEVTAAGVNAAHSYKIRDARMVELGSRLIAFPKTPVEQLRSGTWLTVRMARRAGKPVEIIPLCQRLGSSDQ